MKTKRLSSIVSLLIACMVLPATSFAQDIIMKKNGDEINSKVLEINDSEIKYKKFDNIDGPSYILPKSEVFMIKYADGRKVIINRMDVPDASEPKKEIANEKKIFQEKKSYISLGYGFGTFLGVGSASWLFGNNSFYQDNSNGSLTGPFYMKYEYGVTEDFGIGINLAYLEYKFSDSNYYGYYYFTSNQVQFTRTYTYTSFSGLLRANWHFGNSDKVDPYFGFGLGYRTGTWKYTSNDPLGTKGTSIVSLPFGFETTFGIRIRFSEHVGAYAEAGLAKSAVQLGCTIKY